MSIVSINPQLWVSTPWWLSDAASNVTLDAAGESLAVVGYLRLQLGASGSKTCSSAGGAIYYHTGTSVTFSNGSSNLRLGLQDPASTGLEDGTFDVQADLVGGTDTITTNSWYKIPMESGTKTLAEGDLVAIAVELTARGGADTLTVRRAISNVFGDTTAPGSGFPYGTADTGTLAKSTNMLAAAILFDDGTIGWIDGVPPIPLSGDGATLSINVTSSPDEYIGTFTPVAPMRVTGILWGGLTSIATTDDFEVILYQDPSNTPSVIQAVAIDPDFVTNGNCLAKITPVTLAAGTEYGVAIRPTTVNNITIRYFDLLTGNDGLKQGMATLGVPCKFSQRTSQSGAFGEVQTYYMPLFGLLVNGLDNGAGGAGGLKHPFALSGGLV